MTITHCSQNDRINGRRQTPNGKAFVHRTLPVKGSKRRIHCVWAFGRFVVVQP